MQSQPKLETARSTLAAAEAILQPHRIGAHSSNITMVFSLARTINNTVESHHLNRSANEALALKVCQTIKVAVGALSHHGIEEGNLQYVILDKLCSIVTRVKDYLEAHYQRNAINRLFTSSNSSDTEHSRILSDELDATTALATQAIERLGGSVSPFRVSESYEGSVRSFTSVSMPNPLPSPTIQVRMPTAEFFVPPMSSFGPSSPLADPKTDLAASGLSQEEIPPPYVKRKTTPDPQSEPQSQARPLPQAPQQQSQPQSSTSVQGSPQNSDLFEAAKKQGAQDLKRSSSSSSSLTYRTVPGGSPASSRGTTPPPPSPQMPVSPKFPVPSVGSV